MSGIADFSVGFMAARVPRDPDATAPDLNLIPANDDLYFFANILIGNAISNGVDVHETIGADATAQPSSANG
jgi:hypothetical protein